MTVQWKTKHLPSSPPALRTHSREDALNNLISPACAGKGFNFTDCAFVSEQGLNTHVLLFSSRFPSGHVADLEGIDTVAYSKWLIFRSSLNHSKWFYAYFGFGLMCVNSLRVLKTQISHARAVLYKAIQYM